MNTGVCTMPLCPKIKMVYPRDKQDRHTNIIDLSQDNGRGYLYNAALSRDTTGYPGTNNTTT